MLTAFFSPFPKNYCETGKKTAKLSALCGVGFLVDS